MLDIIDYSLGWFNQNIGQFLLLFILIPTGLYYIFSLKFLNITKFWHAINIIRGKYDKKGDKGEVNHFKALATALSGTVGTGNIVGVSLAIYYGGPGAVFWMWVTGLLGMMVKYVECSLSLRYRRVNQDGSISGGPMYYMEDGLKSKLGRMAKVLALIFAFATIISTFGTGNLAQANSIADALYDNYQIPDWATGIVIAILVMLVTIGGIKRIAVVTSRLVPFMAVFYFFVSFFILAVFIKELPAALYLIVTDAFTGTAAVGGFAGSSFLFALRFGVARGIFSNEAGQGSAAIALAASKNNSPARTGLVSAIGPFIDTLIVCSLTALVIIVTGVWKSGIEGVGMTIDGFNTGFGEIGLFYAGEHIIAFTLTLFAFSTLLAWSYYGVKASEYLWGKKSVRVYLIIYGIFVFLGAVFETKLVWNFVDMALIFMSIPNLIAILLLSGEVKQYTKEYIKSLRK
ncbi:MAG: alanine/glycine:cation symporter family protein [Bacteroidota bacterium]